MKKLIPLMLLVLSGIGLFWPLVTFSSGDAQPPTDPSVMTNYDATYRIAADGHLDATERLTVNLPAGRHGIFRYFPVADPTDPHLRIVPTVTRITFDSGAVPVSYSWQDGRSVYVARIGDPDSTVSPGVHTYVISYTVDGVLVKPPNSRGDFTAHAGVNQTAPGSSFYWNTVGFWEMPIQAAKVVIDLPEKPGLVQCSASADGAIPCAIEGADTNHPTVTATDLPARNPVTVRVDLTGPPPHRTMLPWTVRFDPIFGRSVSAAGLVAVLSLLAALLGYLCARRSRERSPGLPVMYAPPDGLGPVQSVYIVKEKVGDHALVATLLHLAERGLVRLKSTDSKNWTVANIGTPEQWADVDPVTSAVAAALGVSTEGAELVVDGNRTVGETLARAQNKPASACQSWSRNEGLMVSSTQERVEKSLAWICIALAVVGFCIGGVKGASMWGLPFAAFAIAGLGLLSSGVGTRHTEAGRQLWSRAGGFERLLATPSSEDRFDYAARKDLFISYVPYAVAFGVADKWAAKYRTATGQEPPIPAWYPAAAYVGASNLYSPSGFSSFNSAVASSISAYHAYQAAQSSASSGGSSWSGGGGWGGGGGGGGGSW